MASGANDGVWEQGSGLARGSSVGRFLVIGRLGQGGMGEVLSAYDPDLDRRVAIKVLHPEGSGRGAGSEGQARLVREAQAMAKLSHPNVVTVYEVGTVGEQVFVAMELVEGGTLGDWMESGRRGWRELRDVLVRAGRGLAAAHAAGLVHRDFKPDNVLVGKDGRVVVTDFGLAGLHSGTPAPPAEPAVADVALDATLPVPAVHAHLTTAGALLGTPHYMAPEQHKGLTADARADQFSFCVTLYEAVYGEAPFAGASYSELSANVLAGAVRAAPRNTRVPAWLRRTLLRGLRVDPEERYPSMDALLDRLTADPTATRRRMLLAVAALTAAGGLGAWYAGRPPTRLCRGAEAKLAGVWDPSVRSRVRAAFLATRRPYAESSWQLVARELDGYARRWAAMHREACEATRLRGEQSEDVLDLRMSCLDRRSQELRALTELLARADEQVVQRSSEAARALTAVDECADAARLAQPLAPPRDPDRLAKVQAVRGTLAEIQALRNVGRFRDALPKVDPAVAAAEATGYEPLRAEALLLAGRIYLRAGDARTAEARLKDAALAARAAGHDGVEATAWSELVQVVGMSQARFDEGLELARIAEASIARLHDDGRRAELLGNVASVLRRQGKYEEARLRLVEALALRAKIHGRDEPGAAYLENKLGLVLTDEGRNDEAIGHLRRAASMLEQLLGPDHPDLAAAFNNIGLALQGMGKGAEALVEYRRAQAIAERALGPDHPHVAVALTNEGNVLQEQGEYEEARRHHEGALRIQDKALGAEHPDVAVTLNSLGNDLEKLGKYDEALACQERALAIRLEVFGPDHPEVAGSLDSLGSLAVRRGEYAKAVDYHRRALAIREAARGRDDPDVAGTLVNLGEALQHQDKLVEARDCFARALAIWEKALGPEHPRLAYALTGLGEADLGLGDPSSAIAPLERAVALRQAAGGDGNEIAYGRFLLAEAMWDAKRDRGRAIQLAQEARDAFAAGHEAGARGVVEVDRWLRRHAPQR